MGIDREKMLSIGSISRRSRAVVCEGRDEAGHRFKATTDELNNTVTERHGDRQDVLISAPTVAASVKVREVR